MLQRQSRLAEPTQTLCQAIRVSAACWSQLPSPIRGPLGKSQVDPSPPRHRGPVSAPALGAESGCEVDDPTSLEDDPAARERAILLVGREDIWPVPRWGGGRMQAHWQVVTRSSTHGRPRQWLAAASVLVGVVAGSSIVAGSILVFGPSGSLYWSKQVSVPAGANESHPDQVTFHGATFTLWWPYVRPGASSGVIGVSITITEPSGAVDQTGTGCGACTFNQHTWYSDDGVVGIAWYDRAMGDVTLLVRV